MFYDVASNGGDKPVVQVNVVLEYCFAPPDPRIDEWRATAPRDYLADCLFGNKMFSIDLLGGFGIEASRQYRANKRRAKAAQAAAKNDHPLRFKVPNAAVRSGDAPPSEAQIKASKAAEKAEKKADKEQRRLVKERDELAERERAVLAAVTVPWHPSEDAVLSAAVQQYGSSWELVASIVSAMASGRRRSALQCLHRYVALVKPDATAATGGAPTAGQKRRANQQPVPVPLRPMQPSVPLPRSTIEQQRCEARMLAGLVQRYPLPRHVPTQPLAVTPASVTLPRLAQMAFESAAVAGRATPDDIAAAKARYVGAVEVLDRARADAAREQEAARQREAERQQQELALRQQQQLQQMQQMQQLQQMQMQQMQMKQHALAQQRGVSIVQSGNTTFQPWVQSPLLPPQMIAPKMTTASPQQPVVAAVPTRWPQNVVQPVPSAPPQFLHQPVPRRQDARPINFSLFAPPVVPPVPIPVVVQAGSMVQPQRFASQQQPPQLSVPAPPRTAHVMPVGVAGAPPPPPPPPPQAQPNRIVIRAPPPPPPPPSQ